ncbi:ElyC/SanA/YdcF family protein [Desulfosporosinus sp. BG]|uniref:SanA/YdcF family protein n=1 Tax=Desulfosporosinus sp. BG TaxID=1633135 RepID=UPI00083AAA8B|nr:ElyC/SanA/YdcF family protein [Desulfosporosinus sp. BG]ODA39542.1 SanA protein [Desulfosporosinus sp. BG]
MKNRVKHILYVSVVLLIAATIGTLTINEYVKHLGSKYILSSIDVPKCNAILVLGAYVAPDGTVSPMLNDRLVEAEKLYELGKAPKVLVSGDHGRMDYDEVNAMRTFLQNKNIPPEDIFMDHAGFSTYESIYRARDIFQVHKVIIVTQQYHLMRAVFNARALGLDAYGVASDLQDYGEVMKVYNLREIAARNKDFIISEFIKPKPTFLGQVLPVSGDGRVTDDK